MKKSIVVKIIAIFLAVLMAASVLFSVIATVQAGAVSKSQINALETKRKELKQKKQDIQAKINSLEYEQSAEIAKKAVLDEQVQLTENEIENLTEQIAEYTVMIKNSEEDVRKAEISEAEQWEKYKARMRAMEEGGTLSYLAVILSAADFSDLLSKIDSVSEVMEYDKQVYKNLVKAREDTIAAKEALEETKAGQEEKKAELEVSQTELEAQVAEASVLIQKIENSIGDYEKFYEETTAEENKIQSEIAKMEEELKKQEAAGRGSVKGTGNFVWPSAVSRIVTSKFGSRYHPIFKVYKFHNGIDIGGAGYGTNILAADGGKVITSTYSSSYGNYVVISHGNGYTTLYAHMSKRLVSVGNTVKQGQVIGLVGSTGNSTGPHIHFEISKNGTRIDPLQFFTNYTVRE